MQELAAREELREFIIQAMREICTELPPSWPDSAIFRTDLNLDSLGLVELVARIEQRYGIYVPDADLPQFVSMESTLRYIHEHRNG